MLMLIYCLQFQNMTKVVVLATYCKTMESVIKIIEQLSAFCTLYALHRGVGSIFRLRGHQKCKPQIESRSRNLITKWKDKLEDVLKRTMCFWHTFWKTSQGIECKGLAFTIWKETLIWTICAFRVLNHHQWSLTKQSS